MQDYGKPSDAKDHPIDQAASKLTDAGKLSIQGEPAMIKNLQSRHRTTGRHTLMEILAARAASKPGQKSPK